MFVAAHLLFCAAIARAKPLPGPENRTWEIFSLAAQTHQLNPLQLSQPQWERPPPAPKTALGELLGPENETAVPGNVFAYNPGPKGFVIAQDVPLLSGQNAAIAQASGYSGLVYQPGPQGFVLVGDGSLQTGITSGSIEGAIQTGGTSSSGATDPLLLTAPDSMRLGQLVEGPALQTIGSSGKVTFTPTEDQINSAAFQVIVGEPQYTPSGDPVSTIYGGSTASGPAEIKPGSSVLGSSYQLRLQVYGSLINNQPYTIYTSRPLNPSFSSWLQRWGVQVQPLP